MRISSQPLPSKEKLPKILMSFKIPERGRQLCCLPLFMAEKRHGPDPVARNIY